MNIFHTFIGIWYKTAKFSHPKNWP